MSLLRTAMSRANYTAPPANEEMPVETAQGLDAMEKEIRGIEQHVVSLQCEIQKLGKQYMQARAELMQKQTAFCERLKDSGIMAHAVRVPPEIEMIQEPSRNTRPQ